jgi:hypothetical protein
MLHRRWSMAMGAKKGTQTVKYLFVLAVQVKTKPKKLYLFTINIRYNAPALSAKSTPFL